MANSLHTATAESAPRASRTGKNATPSNPATASNSFPTAPNPVDAPPVIRKSFLMAFLFLPLCKVCSLDSICKSLLYGSPQVILLVYQIPPPTQPPQPINSSTTQTRLTPTLPHNRLPPPSAPRFGCLRPLSPPILAQRRGKVGCGAKEVATTFEVNVRRTEGKREPTSPQSRFTRLFPSPPSRHTQAPPAPNLPTPSPPNRSPPLPTQKPHLPAPTFNHFAHNNPFFLLNNLSPS